MNNAEIQSAANDDGDGSSGNDGPSRSSGQWAAAARNLLTHIDPPGTGRKA